MRRFSKEGDANPWRRFSIPIFSIINTEVSPTCDCQSPDDNNSSNGQSENPKTLQQQRNSFFSSVLSICGSSIYEKPESAPSIDLDKEQGTSDLSSRQNLQNARSGSCQSINKLCGDDATKLRVNTLCMTQANSVVRGPAEAGGSAGAPVPAKNLDSPDLIQASFSSKARQKKFHRHFKQVDDDEKVLNYYSCALVGDILLQGHLYITENFFAFYSNVFGYVTKLLIPTVDVLKISKEKTARIIPNAVGISTEDEKHVFGSLLSRDSTYKFMVQVWKAAISSNSEVKMKPPPIIKTELPSDEESSGSSANEDPSPYISNLSNHTTPEDFQKLIPSMKRGSILMTPIEPKQCKQTGSWRTNKCGTALAISLILLVLLVVSAGYLLYRIAVIQNRFDELSIARRGFNTEEMYEDILKWQSALHSTSTSKMHDFLHTNIDQIAKVRLSLEALSALIFPIAKSDTNNFNSNQMTRDDLETNDRETG